MVSDSFPRLSLPNTQGMRWEMPAQDSHDCGCLVVIASQGGGDVIKIVLVNFDGFLRQVGLNKDREKRLLFLSDEKVAQLNSVHDKSLCDHKLVRL